MEESSNNKEQLFLFELLIDTIVFSEGTVPQKKHVICNCNFESVVSFEIRVEGSSAIEKEERDSKRRDMEFNGGKSYLFSCNPLELLTAVETYPLEISICTRMNPLPYGTSIVDWGSEFSDMVQASSESYGYVTPAAIYGLYNLRDSSGLPVGSVDLFIRLSCFGKNIQTSFQVIQQQTGKDGVVGPRQYLFKYTNAGTTFICERYGMGTSQEVLPIAPIYNATDIEPVSHFKTLFSNAASRQSVMPFLDLDFLNRDQQQEFDFSNFLLEYDDTTSDTLSLRIRPVDMKITNIVGLLKELQEQELNRGIGGGGMGGSGSSNNSNTSLDDLTADVINKRLCKNPNCPAAIKFKEYGLGPLANNNGIGCALTNAKTPYVYGLSHVNGTMNNYGPYGIYTRPKRSDLPFIPKKKPSIVPSSSSSNSPGNDTKRKKKRTSTIKQCGDVTCSKTTEERLRGGSDPYAIEEEEEEQHRNEITVKLNPQVAYESIENSFRGEVLRLRGGVSIRSSLNTIESDHSLTCDNDDQRIKPRNILYYRAEFDDDHQSEFVPLRLKGGWSVPQENISATSTTKNVTKPLRLIGGGGAYDEDKQPNPMSSVKNLLQDFDRVVEAYRRALGPCGRGICPFAPNVIEESCRKVCRENLPGNVQEQTPIDRMVECESCSMANLDNDEDLTACGSSKCPYGRLNTKSETEEQLKAMQEKPACGDYKCPFVKKGLNIYDEDVIDLDVLPRNCGVPTCKFKATDDLPPIHWDCPEPLPKDGKCKNPNCPFLPQLLKCYEPKCVCDLPNCAYAMPPSCGNPTCPFKPPNNCPYANNQQQSTCPYAPPTTTNCPFENKKNKPASMCGNPECEYAKTVESCPFTNNSKCGNPECPYAEELEACPYALSNNNPEPQTSKMCPNPKCPYAPKQKPSPCYLPPPAPCYQPTPAPCYTLPPPSCYPPKPVCSDPICPFREIICTNPVCQLSSPLCDPDTCPLLKPEPETESDDDDDSINECQCPPCLALQEEFCEECFRERQEAAQALLIGLGLGKRDDDRRLLSELTPCCSETCQFKKKDGGNLICDKCVNIKGGDDKDGGTMKRSKLKKKDTANYLSTGRDVKTLVDVTDIKRKYKGKYIYSLGDDYPGVKIGHRQCLDKIFRVPYNMGWLWNLYSTPGLKPRYGWKPGAIGYTIANMIKKHRELKGLKMQFPPDPNGPLRRGKRKKGGAYSAYGSESDESITPKPTLQIKKKEGTYFITMNPLKDPYAIEDNENPYVNCTPMQFRITKNKKNKKKNELGAIMDDRGDADGGGGGDEYKTCYCNDDEDAKNVESSSSDSELDIEFTPPAGIIRPDRLKRKKTVVHTDTQYNPDDYKDNDKKKGKGKGKGKEKGKGKKGKGGGKGKAAKKGGKKKK